MKALRWIYRRLGASFCFLCGIGFALAATQRFTDLAMVAYAIIAAAFLLTGLGLAALTTWREVDDPLIDA
jgi:hypothetical protein